MVEKVRQMLRRLMGSWVVARRRDIKRLVRQLADFSTRLKSVRSHLRDIEKTVADLDRRMQTTQHSLSCLERRIVSIKVPQLPTKEVEDAFAKALNEIQRQVQEAGSWTKKICDIADAESIAARRLRTEVKGMAR